MALRAREGARLLAKERSPGEPLAGVERESAIRSSKHYGEERKRSPNLNFTANISEAIQRAGFTAGNEGRASRPYSGVPASSAKSAAEGVSSTASTPTGQAALEAVARAKNSRNFSSVLQKSSTSNAQSVRRSADIVGVEGLQQARASHERVAKGAAKAGAKQSVNELRSAMHQQL